ncbi:unnamed protein product [Phytophthora fragariaefolia]|uniref:Unnamed protein product n=1 Tax=Phytophthora fragariaefolia TaxID=1490495 RepID=A0A9W6X4I6_9STRA|nr:unnamed protein product [Phytophthora fragariaefolia]
MFGEDLPLSHKLGGRTGFSRVGFPIHVLMTRMHGICDVATCISHGKALTKSRASPRVELSQHTDPLSFQQYYISVRETEENRAAVESKRSAERKEYNQGSKLRWLLREKYVVEAKRYLETYKPPLSELCSFLNTFEVRFRGYAKKKMTATLSKSEPDPTPMPFRLSETIVTAALLKAVEKEAEMQVSEKEVDLCAPVEGTTRVDADTKWCIVHIEGGGEFSRNRLEAMKYLWNVAKTCSRGMQSYSWLMSEVYVHFSDEGAQAVESEMINAWPEDTISGFSFEVHWAHTYCVRPGVWFNDIIIQAFLKTLSQSTIKAKRFSFHS